MLTQAEKRLAYLFNLIQVTVVLDFVVMMPLAPMTIKDLHITTQDFGHLVSSYNFSSGIVTFLAGNWIDRWERKKLFLFCYLGFILATLLCALSNSFGMMLIARITAGAFGGMATGLVFSYLGDQIRSQVRGEATGMVMTSFSIASVLGVPLGLQLATSYFWQMSFIFIVLLSVVVWFFAFRYLPVVQATNNTALTWKAFTQLYQSVLVKPKAIIGLCIMTLTSASSFMIIPLISLYMVHNLAVANTQLKYLYLIGGVVTFLTSRQIGRWCDTWGVNRIYIIISLLCCIPALAITHINSHSLVIIFTITTLFMMLFNGRFIPVMSMMNNIADAQLRGLYISLSQCIRAVSIAAAAWIAGWMTNLNEVSGLLEGYGKNGWVSVAMIMLSLLLVYMMNKFKAD